jgi:hexosaminidase
MWVRKHRLPLIISLVAVCGVAAWVIIAGNKTPAPRPPAAAATDAVIPAPVHIVPATDVTFTLPVGATIASDTAGIGDYLAGILRTSTGYAIPASDGSGAATIELRLSGAPGNVGDEGYGLTVSATSVVIRARKPAGLFEGVQTLLQLLPAAVQGSTVASGPWTIPGQTIVDYPRFGYRGAMLDVARHFFTVDQAERYIDEIAHYKLNYLHLHLSDDQGWRIAIKGWPDLTGHGGSTEVGGGAGGYYSQADYSAIVAYAESRYITVIPEIDMPGHVNAALASEPQLNCNGKAPGLYTGINVGFSSLCVPLDRTYDFVDQVIGQLAALTPGPYIHIGGDESSATSTSDYTSFVDRAQKVVRAHGKIAIGWHNIASAPLLPTSIAEFWDTTVADAWVAAAAAKGTKVIMAPANHAYMDMKYNGNTKLGQQWAGLIDVNTAYDWNPGHYLMAVGESSVAGVEAGLWTETITTSDDIDYMAFPRLPAIAELGWSPWSTHDDTSFDARLAAQGPRWKAMGIHYYHSDQIAWPAGS